MPNNYVLLERIELNASAASVTFASIPQTGYTDLKVVVSARTDSSNTGAYGDGLIFYYNSLTTNLSTKRLYGQGNGPVGSTGGSIQYGGMVSTSGQTANTFGSSEIYIPNYAGSSFKSSSGDGVSENNATTNQMQIAANLWSSTAAITSITFALETGSTNFAANSTFSLYGLAALGTTPAIAPKASGGNIIDYDGTYWIHTFLSSGTFTPAIGLTCDYLVIAGGGGAGRGTAGGGGAGGYQAGSSFAVASTTPISVTVGAGGAAQTTADTPGNAGSNSVFSSITANGGGRGGSYYGATGGNGGSGGGAGNDDVNNNIQGGTGSQGFNGGGSVSNSYYAGGGGGGSSAAGGSPTSSSSAGGAGGAGTASSISGTSVTRAGGGGGSTVFGSAGGAGGSGGGGAGGKNPASGNAATINTGSGGGAGHGAGGGGAGGSGIVIIRYPAA
jgi:hypothetical protein